MGRPPLHVEETKVRLKVGTKARIITLVGENKMASYIREAVEERLARDEAAKGGDDQAGG